MTVREIVHKLAEKYPPELALAWDNPGLQVGGMDWPVEKIYVALEATDAVIQECIAWEADLLVTHHPLLMSGIKKVNSEEFPGCKLLRLAENRIAHYAMHTNYDVTEMSALAIRALGLTETQILETTGAFEDGTEYGVGFVGLLSETMTAEDGCCAGWCGTPERGERTRSGRSACGSRCAGARRTIFFRTRNRPISCSTQR